ncbi:MAG TPA: PilZ domain-containing protein [Vicinamibacteria bacterium]|jgi:hypothetical protein
MREHREGESARIACAEPCWIEHAAAGPGMVWNLSVTGAYIVTDSIPGVGDEFTISFTLPGSTGRISARVRTIWQNIPSRVKGMGQSAPVLPPGCGVRFVDLERGDQHRIEQRVGVTLALAPGVAVRPKTGSPH